MRTVGKQPQDPLRLPPRLLVLMKPVVGQLIETMTTHIQTRVVDWGGDRARESRAVIERSVRAGVTSFVDVLSGGPAHTPEIDELFQEVGRQEALHGHSMENLRATMLVAAHMSWRVIHRRAREYQIPEGLLGRIGDALFTHIDRIERQMTLGHLNGSLELRSDVNQWRGDLAAELLSEGREQDVEELAAAKGWRLPEEIQVVAIATARGREFPDVSVLPKTLLVHLARPASAVIGSPQDVQRILPRLATLFTDAPTAVSWPVAPDDGAAGFRWANRALELRELGVIAGTGAVECADHVSTLWVHAEPLMRDRVIDERLAPLMRESERSRQVLAETLLLLLETRGSAPAMAERLGVHPQTVRYRLRRLRDLFGDQLDDSKQNMSLLLALEAIVPLWRAGRGLQVQKPA